MASDLSSPPTGKINREEIDPKLEMWKQKKLEFPEGIDVYSKTIIRINHSLIIP